MSEEAEAGSWWIKPTKKQLQPKSPQSSPQIQSFSKNSPEEGKQKITTNLSLRDLVCIINLHCIWLLKTMYVFTQPDSRAVV